MKRRVLAFGLLVSAALLLFLWTTLPGGDSLPVVPGGVAETRGPHARGGPTAGLPVDQVTVSEMSARRE
ncbi:MAG TPA: hypothetical protein VMS76_09160, partial [Planctomycetota bacterium]|nr:hypothetical protein [Planctomycetota bacterium]